LPPLFAVVGRGFAYDESTLRTDRNPNVGSQSNHTGAVAFGGGIDVRSGSWLGLRGEVRDVISGARRFAIPTPGERVQNLVATIGLVSALERPPGPPADALLQLRTSTSPVAGIGPAELGAIWGHSSVFERIERFQRAETLRIFRIPSIPRSVSGSTPAASTISPLPSGRSADVVSKSRMAASITAGLRCM
jgi:hypothetical protein